MVMELKIGDRIVYSDTDGDTFRGKIIDTSKNNEEEITGYFVVTNSGLYIHFHTGNLTWCRFDESVPVPE